MISTKFKRDHHTRATLFHTDSFQHQGRANLYHLLALSKILPPLGGVRGGPPLIIDPMAGTGSTYIYTDLGYPVICGDIEPHWAKLLETNRQTITISRLFSASTPTKAAQWDAARLPLASGSVGAVITSPPYWDMLSDWHISSSNLQADGHPAYGLAYGVHPQNVGNLHIYENYLRAMFAVYREAYRVLAPGPGTILALILKDRIHKGRQIPIVKDSITLAAALGFELVDRLDRECINSLHRNVLTKKHSLPNITTEPALIFKKKNQPPRPKKTAFIQAPNSTERTSPSYQLFNKAFNYTLWADQVFILDAAGPKNTWHLTDLKAPAHNGFRERKAYAYDCVANLVLKHGFGSGSEIELHCSMDYAPYIHQRAKTLGIKTTNPTQGLNLGQKLKWYTENGSNSYRVFSHYIAV